MSFFSLNFTMTKVGHHTMSIDSLILQSGRYSATLSSLSSANRTWQSVHPVWSISSHSLYENSSTQVRPHHHSASQYFWLHALSCVCPSTLLFARPRFAISTRRCCAFPPPRTIAQSPSPPSALASNTSFQLSALTQPTTILTVFVVAALPWPSSPVFQSTSYSYMVTRDRTPSAALALPLETRYQVADVIAAGLFSTECDWTVWNSCQHDPPRLVIATCEHVKIVSSVS